MSIKETPLTRRFWRETKGTLIEEFLAVPRGPAHGYRRIDGIIILGEEFRIAKANEVDIAGKDIIVIQTKAGRLGMPLMGQAVFSARLMERFEPASIRSVAICTKPDRILTPLLESYGVEVVVYDDYSFLMYVLSISGLS